MFGFRERQISRFFPFLMVPFAEKTFPSPKQAITFPLYNIYLELFFFKIAFSLQILHAYVLNVKQALFTLCQ